MQCRTDGYGKLACLTACSALCICRELEISTLALHSNGRSLSGYLEGNDDSIVHCSAVHCMMEDELPGGTCDSDRFWKGWDTGVSE